MNWRRHIDISTAYRQYRKTLALMLYLCSICCAYAAPETIRISAAKSFTDSGLLRSIIDQYAVNHPGIDIKISSVGSLQALEHVRTSQADLVISHYPLEEQRLVQQGLALKRTELAYSKFVIFGPPDGELKLSQKRSAIDALKAMAEEEVTFVAPSPMGGTYAKIEELWALAGTLPDWPDYEFTRLSSTAALDQAAMFSSYTIADIGSYLANKERYSQSIVPLYQNDIALQNTYSIIVVKQDDELNKAAIDLYDYLISDTGQEELYTQAKVLFNADIITAAAKYDIQLQSTLQQKELLEERRTLKFWLAGVSALLFFSALAVYFYLSMLKEEKLRKFNEHENELLILAAQSAEHANQLKTEFLSNVSHELRTPMHAILGFSDLAMKTNGSQSKEKIENYLHKINISGKRLLNLINNLLDLAKLEAGRTRFDMQEYDIDSVIDDVLSETQTLIEDKNISISLSRQSDHTKACVDKEKLFQVVYNLLTNAIKFSPQDGTINIRINESEIRVGDRSIPAATVAVSDEGAGIPEQELDVVFDKFVQSSKAAETSGSSGLGLAISKEIISAHHGIITAANNQMGGAVFSFSIPQQQHQSA